MFRLGGIEKKAYAEKWGKEIIKVKREGIGLNSLKSYIVIHNNRMIIVEVDGYYQKDIEDIAIEIFDNIEFL